MAMLRQYFLNCVYKNKKLISSQYTSSLNPKLNALTLVLDIESASTNVFGIY